MVRDVGESSSDYAILRAGWTKYEHGVSRNPLRWGRPARIPSDLDGVIAEQATVVPELERATAG